MDDLSRKFRSIDWKGLQKSARRVQASTASALKDMVMTDLENKVRAATADTTWGASGSDLMQIAQGTYNREDYALIMSIVWQRLGSSRWRCVFKALEVLRHLIMHGSARCTEEARAAAHHIQTLQHFRYVDPKSKRDCGEGVRNRAKLVCDMLADDSILEEEREKSKEIRAKMQGGVSMGPGGRISGLSSDDYRYGSSQAGDGRYEEGVTRTSTGGVGSFKGYGEDDSTTGEGYDEVPARRIADKAGAVSGSAMVPIPDLMGDEPETGTGGGQEGFADDEDDDDFDPRAGNAGGLSTTAGAAGDDLLFGALTSTDLTTPAHIGTSSGDTRKQMSTSMLVQSLAKQKHQQQMQLQPYEQGAPQNSRLPQDNASDQEPFPYEVNLPGSYRTPDSGPNRATSSATNASTTATSTASEIPVEPTFKVSAKPDADPFGDLMATAKKSGVL